MTIAPKPQLIAGVDAGCFDTHLLLSGKNEIPEELAEYTDGYAA
jgi:hypothetical protein